MMQFLLESEASWEGGFGKLDFTGFLDMYEHPGKITSFGSMDKDFPVEAHAAEFNTSLGAFFGYADIIPGLEIDVCFFGETIHPETIHPEKTNHDIHNSDTGEGGTSFKPKDSAVLDEMLPGSISRNTLGLAVGKSSEIVKIWYNIAVTDLLHMPGPEGFQLHSADGRNPYVLYGAVPNTWYQSAWVFMKGDRQKVFLGFGRKWNLFERDQWWFETKALAENEYFQGEFSFFTAPFGAKSISGKQNETISILEISTVIYPAEGFSMGSGWDYTLKKLSPWSKDESCPGKINWETHGKFQSGEKGKELGVELAYQYSFSNTYASGKKGLSGEMNKKMHRFFTFKVFTQIQTLSLISESSFYISRRYEGIFERMEHSVKGEAVFESADCSINGSFDYEYNFGKKELSEYSTSIEYEKELSWGSFSIRLDNFKNIGFLCSIESIDFSSGTAKVKD